MDIYNEIKNRVKMKDMLAHFGILPARGRNIYKCPFHDDKSPSANIIQNTDIFNCFSCHWHGDIFAVFEAFQKTQRRSTVKLIDKEFNLGLIHNLTRKEIKEIELQEAIRKKKIEERKQYEIDKKEILNNIINRLNFWREAQNLSHITRGEYRRGEWKLIEPFFIALSEQDRLEWLYFKICEIDQPESEFDYIYDYEPAELVHKIKEGEIYI